jgi:acyl carrier protein phosphodiesterase
MNWLAHLFLSESSPEFRLGNLLPDLLEKNSLSDFGPEVQRGIEFHGASTRLPIRIKSSCRAFAG